MGPARQVFGIVRLQPSHAGMSLESLIACADSGSVLGRELCLARIVTHAYTLNGVGVDVGYRVLCFMQILRRNGERVDEFALTEDGPVEQLEWDKDGEVLAVLQTGVRTCLGPRWHGKLLECPF
jgi:hypothetical protein